VVSLFPVPGKDPKRKILIFKKMEGSTFSKRGILDEDLFLPGPIGHKCAVGPDPSDNG
jgi:hypothetical protein